MSHGLYRPTRDVSGSHEDLLAWKLVLPPSGAFTHLSAAGEYGWWLPPLPDDLPVFVSMAANEGRPKREGLRVARLAGATAIEMRGGLPLTGPEETLLACARDLRLLDMVVLVDAALHMKSCTPDDIAELAQPRRRGAPMLQQALRLADARSESAWETMLRMLHVACEVPVEPQLEVFDETGAFVARGDLWISGTKTLHEYDGDEHLQRPRQRKDLRRQRELGHLDWTRRGYTSHEVTRQAVGILRDADESLGRPHRPERARAWHALLTESLFTPTGTERLRARLGLNPPATAQMRPAREA